MTDTTCTKRVIIDATGPRKPSNFRKCGAAGMVTIGGDGHRSYYCEEHARRDAQGYPYGMRIPREGIDRHYCGAKYWDGDKCASCGGTFNVRDLEGGY